MGEELSKRIDDLHKRFDDLRGDLNRRFEEVNQPHVNAFLRVFLGTV